MACLSRLPTVPQPLPYTRASYFLKNCHLQPLITLFSIIFKNYNFYITIMKKCASSLWCWDLKSQPLELESRPITSEHNLRILIDNNILSSTCTHSHEQLYHGLTQEMSLRKMETSFEMSLSEESQVKCHSTNWCVKNSHVHEH